MNETSIAPLAEAPVTVTRETIPPLPPFSGLTELQTYAVWAIYNLSRMNYEFQTQSRRQPINEQRIEAEVARLHNQDATAASIVAAAEIPAPAEAPAGDTAAAAHSEATNGHRPVGWLAGAIKARANDLLAKLPSRERPGAAPAENVIVPELVASPPKLPEKPASPEIIAAVKALMDRNLVFYDQNLGSLKLQTEATRAFERHASDTGITLRNHLIQLPDSPDVPAR